MAKKGLFKSTGALLTTTISKTETTTYELLDGVENTGKIISGLSQEFLNDTREDLIDSRVRLAEKLAEAKARLVELGYSEEEIAEMLNLNRVA